jgi:hypothetical protein
MVNLLERFRQTVCSLHGHDALLQFERDRVYLKCFSCGYESPGCKVKAGVHAAHGARARDTQTPALVQPNLMGARRVA